MCCFPLTFARQSRQPSCLPQTWKCFKKCLNFKKEKNIEPSFCNRWRVWTTTIKNRTPANCYTKNYFYYQLKTKKKKTSKNTAESENKKAKCGKRKSRSEKKDENKKAILLKRKRASCLQKVLENKTKMKLNKKEKNSKQHYELPITTAHTHTLLRAIFGRRLAGRKQKKTWKE